MGLCLCRVLGVLEKQGQPLPEPKRPYRSNSISEQPLKPLRAVGCIASKQIEKDKAGEHQKKLTELHPQTKS